MENYYGSFKKITDPKIMNLLDNLIDIAEKLNTKIYLAGGIVRDFFLGCTSRDIDIVVESEHRRLIESFIKSIEKIYNLKTVSNDKLITTSINFEFCNIDLVQMRSEIYERPGALPRVVADNIFKDCHRRDFTINSLYFSLAKGKMSLIDIDYYMSDLQRKILKIHHNESFQDDPTRILRGIRYQNRLGFHFDRDTYGKLIECLNNKCLENISIERLIKEFILLIREDKYLDNINTLCSLDLDVIYFNKKINSNIDKYIDYKSCMTTWTTDDIVFFRLLELIYININLIDKKEIIKFIKNKRVISIVELVYSSKRYYSDLAGSDYYQLINTLDKLSERELCFLLIRGDQFTKNLILKYKKLKSFVFSFGGAYIKQAGFKEGKVIGRILRLYKNQCLEKLVENEFQNLEINLEKKIIDSIIDQEIGNGI